MGRDGSLVERIREVSVNAQTTEEPQQLDTIQRTRTEQQRKEQEQLRLQARDTLLAGLRDGSLVERIREVSVDARTTEEPQQLDTMHLEAQNPSPCRVKS